jgi:hypothetical protein
VPDDRAAHLWDGTGASMRAFQSALGLGEEAWDVFLLYDRNARWNGDVPPQPKFWMHQLSSSLAPHLEPEEFAKQANALLGSR